MAGLKFYGRTRAARGFRGICCVETLVFFAKVDGTPVRIRQDRRPDSAAIDDLGGDQPVLLRADALDSEPVGILSAVHDCNGNLFISRVIAIRACQIY